MKKKLLTLMCVLACVLSLTACGEKTTELSAFEEQLVSQCENFAYNSVYVASDYVMLKEQGILPSLNKEEMAVICQQEIGCEAELGAFDGLIATYSQMSSDMGGVNDIGDITSDVVGKEIIVTVQIFGNDCDGQIVFTYSKDIFTRFKEGNAVANTSFSQKMDEAGKHMGDAALNTVLGMGTVFSMLILISIIISLFGVFKKKDSKPQTKVVESVTPVTEENPADDTELVAVIMAAISAFEGNSSTDGFVVRSIKKANRRN